MHPAFSVIFFTVTSGAGYGLMALLCLFNFLYLGMLFDKNIFLIFSGISAVLFTMGLISSTFHLANPKNAWRAFMRFRTSWLAREGLLAILFYPTLFLYLLLIHLDFYKDYFLLMQIYSFFIFIFAILIIYCTGMIYACLKTIPQWNTLWTPINYITIGVYLGGLIFFALLSFNDFNINPYKPFVLAMIFVAFIAKFIYYLSIKGPRHEIGQATNAAIKLKNTNVRLLDVGHTGGTFLTDEFGYKVAEKRLRKIKWFSIFSGFFIPFFLIFSYSYFFENIFLCLFAVLLSFTGMIAERWLFFAEAKHVVNLYHGAQKC